MHLWHVEKLTPALVCSFHFFPVHSCDLSFLFIFIYLVFVARAFAASISMSMRLLFLQLYVLLILLTGCFDVCTKRLRYQKTVKCIVCTYMCDCISLLYKIEGFVFWLFRCTLFKKHEICAVISTDKLSFNYTRTHTQCLRQVYTNTGAQTRVGGFVITSLFLFCDLFTGCRHPSHFVEITCEFKTF